MKKYIINLDLHGGDFAPKSVLKGASIARKKNPLIHYNLHSEKSIYEKFRLCSIFMSCALSCLPVI